MKIKIHIYRFYKIFLFGKIKKGIKKQEVIMLKRKILYLFGFIIMITGCASLEKKQVQNIKMNSGVLTSKDGEYRLIGGFSDRFGGVIDIGKEKNK